MAPKKKTTAADAVSPEAANFINPNISFHEDVQLHLDVLKGYYGNDIDKQQPLKVTDGAFQEPIDFAVMQMRLTDPEWSDKDVICAGGVNALWASPFLSMTPNVKLSQTFIERQIQDLWGKGQVCGLLEPIDYRADGEQNYMRLSPEEPVIALILHVARRIQAGAEEEELNRWKKESWS